MSKRKGRKPLNLDNSDDDSEPEEAGTFTQANEEEVKRRVIKVAKRRLPKKADDGGVFSSLKPTFDLKPQSATNLQSTFSFLKNNNPLAPTSNSEQKREAADKTSNQSDDKFSFKRKCVDDTESKPKQNASPGISIHHMNGNSALSSKENNASSVSGAGPSEEENNPILNRVKILNVECLQWAQQHIDENPLIDLRPVFNDYIKHFEEILEEFKKQEALKPRESNASSETLAKLQNHIKNKNSSENSKTAEKKVVQDSGESNDILSPELNAEMKSKISHHLNRFNYFSSLLANNEESSEKQKVVNSSSEVKLNSPVGSQHSEKQSVDTVPKLDLTSKSGSTPISNTFSFSKSSATFSFGNSTVNSSIEKTSNTSDVTSVKSASEPNFFKTPAVKEGFPSTSLFNKEPFTNSGLTNKSPFSNSTPFSFSTSSNPLNFGGAQKKSETQEGEEEDEDQPPVVKVDPIIEEGSKFTTRCKVFIKKEDNSYADKGVGTLSLKPLENSEKSQLVVRTENALGNILVNLVLSKDIPIQRTGKNNVLLVCLPTPEYEPPPKVVLLRVKTESDADELLKVLKDNQA